MSAAKRTLSERDLSVVRLQVSLALSQAGVGLAPTVVDPDLTGNRRGRCVVQQADFLPST